MTKKQREQVVELLRCAADLFATRRNTARPTREAATGDPGEGDCDDPTYRKAWDVIYTVKGSSFDFHRSLLEAAMRVEEGSWP